MEIVVSIFEKIAELLATNPTAIIVMSYIVGSYFIVTALLLIAKFITSLTKSVKDDAVIKKIEDFIAKYIAPVMIVIPHSNFSVVHKVFKGIVDGAKWLIDLLKKDK